MRARASQAKTRTSGSSSVRQPTTSVAPALLNANGNKARRWVEVPERIPARMSSSIRGPSARSAAVAASMTGSGPSSSAVSAGAAEGSPSTPSRKQMAARSSLSPSASARSSWRTRALRSSWPCSSASTTCSVPNRSRCRSWSSASATAATRMSVAWGDFGISASSGFAAVASPVLPRARAASAAYMGCCNSVVNGAITRGSPLRPRTSMAGKARKKFPLSTASISESIAARPPMRPSASMAATATLSSWCRLSATTAPTATEVRRRPRICAMSANTGASTSAAVASALNAASASPTSADSASTVAAMRPSLSRRWASA